MGRLRAGDFPSPGYLGPYQLKTSRFDCSKSEEEGKYVEHGDTKKWNDGIMAETVEREQLQGASLCRTGCASLLHCHNTYFEDSGTLDFNKEITTGIPEPSF